MESKLAMSEKSVTIEKKGTDVDLKVRDTHHIPRLIDFEDEVLLSWNIPDPWELSKIKPELQFCAAGQDPIVIPYDEDAATAITEVQSAGLLNPNETPWVIFITHGFENDLETEWVGQMRDEILKLNPKVMIVLVGWGGGSDIGILKYSQAAANTQTVGAWLKSYVDGIRGLSKDILIWGIAHSLGAHLMGIAGRLSGAFDRITGLDPAGPSFEKVNEVNRLCATDAKIVDVIHTDGYDTVLDPYDWFAPVNHYGTLIPLGTVDFYPNFGYRQPGIPHVGIAGSHHRAIELFIWSIANPGAFRTNLVLNGVPEFEKPVVEVRTSVEQVDMGFHYAVQPTKGLFYIQTNSSVPWKEVDTGLGEQGWGSYCSIS